MYNSLQTFNYTFNWSHFILSGLNYYILASKISTCTYSGLIALQNTCAAIEVGYG